MSDIAIRVEHLSKKYHIGRLKRHHDTLREAVLSLARHPFSSLLRRGEAEEDDVLWALRDVSFEVRRGEVVGIIGRNGAGKSTLLKIISRITEPTSGRVEMYGRVGSLLEVGTGFHPELTGRENIYLNGAILGMRKEEIDRKFDEIVAFAGVERFLDTPVKRYSSGMYVRLAFAVAAHLEPEILLVDEVLAVGDAEFQKRCLNKMQSIGEEGRTILFVSHNMPAVTRLCERTILLDAGRILVDGPSHRAVGMYLSSGMGTTAERVWPNIDEAPGNEIVRLRAVRIKNAQGQVAEAVDIREPVAVEMVYDVLQPGHKLWPCLTLHNEEGVFVFSAIDNDPMWRGKPRPAGRYTTTTWIPGNLLAEGRMIIGPAMRTINPEILHYHERDAVAFQVIDTTDGTSARGDWAGHMPGVVRPMLQWQTVPPQEASSEDLSDEISLAAKSQVERANGGNT